MNWLNEMHTETMNIVINSLPFWVCVLLAPGALQCIIYCCIRGKIKNGTLQKVYLVLPMLFVILTVYSVGACFFEEVPYPDIFTDSGMLDFPDQYYGILVFSLMVLSSIFGWLIGKFLLRKRMIE